MLHASIFVSNRSQQRLVLRSFCGSIGEPGWIPGKVCDVSMRGLKVVLIRLGAHNSFEVMI